MGKTIRFDRRDDSAADSDEPMELRLYTDGDSDTTLADVTVSEATVVDVVPGCDRVRLGDVYSLDQSGTVVECWVTSEGDQRGEFRALVTVSRGPVQIAARLISLPESFLAGMLLTDYQPVSEASEPVTVVAVAG
jgi:hypothetical protein